MIITLQDAYAAFQRRDYKNAENMFKTILVAHPEAYQPFFFIGSMYLEKGDNAAAIAFLESAADRQPEGQVLNNLGTAFRRENQVKKAMEIYHMAIEVDPENADYLNNMGTLYINEGNPAQGENYFRKAIKIDPKHKHAHWNLSLILLENYRWKEGWQEYAWGLQSKDRMNRWATWPTWEGQSHIEDHGKMRKARVMIYGEQGLGDEIMFASMYPDAIKTGATLYAECHFRLQTVFERSFPSIKFFPTREKAIVENLPEFDYVCPIGGLGRIFRNEPSDFPHQAYLKLDEGKVEFYRNKMKALGPPPYVGMGWKGGSKRTRKDVRSMPLDQWSSLFDVGGTFVSLQYNLDSDFEVVQYNKNRTNKIHHWPDVVREDNYDDIMSLIKACDLIIHVNGTGVHASGAVGAPCWTITPSKPAWRYGLTGDKMVWYESVTQIRQETDWDELSKRLTLRYKNYVDDSKRKNQARLPTAT